MPLRAVVFMLLAMLLFAIQDALFKQLTQNYAVLQLLLLRMSLVVSGLSLVFLLGRNTLTLKTLRWPLMALRGCVAFGAFTLYYLALQKIPLAEGATVLMSAPLFVTVFSVPLLGERVGLHRWVAVWVGFAAVLLLLRPGSDLFQPIMILPLIAAVMYALMPIITRHISATESTFTITFYTTVSYLVLCMLASVFVNLWPATPDSSAFYAGFAEPWSALTVEATLLLCVTAVLFCLSVLLVTGAYRLAQASAIAAFEYCYLIWAMLIGYLLFGELPALLTYLAAAIIVGCGVYIILRERQLNAKIRASAPHY